jgi:hypothetical protein
LELGAEEDADEVDESDRVDAGFPFEPMLIELAAEFFLELVILVLIIRLSS